MPVETRADDENILKVKRSNGETKSGAVKV